MVMRPLAPNAGGTGSESPPNLGDLGGKDYGSPLAPNAGGNRIGKSPKLGGFRGQRLRMPPNPQYWGNRIGKSPSIGGFRGRFSPLLLQQFLLTQYLDRPIPHY
jgi:hypothetical protein